MRELMRNAIDLLNDLRQSDGCTMSRYPTRLEQYIPGFALWWIGMVHGYYWYVDDGPFAEADAAGSAAACWTSSRGTRRTTGRSAPCPGGGISTGRAGWPNGDAPQETDGGAALFDLQLLLAYRWAAALEKAHSNT